MKIINKLNTFIIILTCFTAVPATAQLKKRTQIQTSYISGRFYNKPVSDTISLTVWENFVSLEKRRLMPSKEFTAVVKNGRFSFKIDSLKRSCYVSLGIGKFFNSKPYPLLDLYLLEPGDNINISISTNETIEERDKIKRGIDSQKVCMNCNTFSFTGKGSLKYQYRRELYQAKDSLQNNWFETEPIAKIDPKSFIEMYHRSYSQMVFVKGRELQILDRDNRNIPDEMYRLLKADALAQCNFLFLADLASYYQPNQITERERGIFKKFYIDTVLNRIRNDIPESILATSAFYPQTLINKERLENKIFDQKSIYSRIKNNYTGNLRDRMLSNYLIDNLNKSGVDSMIKDALPLINNSIYKNFLVAAQAKSKVGTHVDFSLQDVAGKIVHISDFKGKVVFVDFWFYGCAGCSSFYREKLSKIEELYKDNPDIIFLTISIDSNKSTWLKAINSNNYTSEKAINLNTGYLGEGHPLIRQLNILSYPALFIVNRNGDIAFNNGDEIREKPDELIKQSLTQKYLQK